MSLNDPLATALANILNAERVKKQSCVIHPVSNLIKGVLQVFHEYHFIGKAELLESSSGNRLQVNLLGRINHCGAIKPRFSVTKDNFKKFEKRFLPAKDFGILVVSTSKGLMTHEEAKKKGIGGRLLAYTY